jgi:preprotein translocase subunit YajC
MISKRRLISIFIISMLVIIVGLSSFACLPAETTGETATAEGAEAGAEETGLSDIFMNYGTWIWLAILAVAFYFLLIRPQRMRSKKAQELMSGLQRGDEIVTIGGFYGRIKEVRDDVIIITIAGGVDVKMTKSAIAKKVNQQQV